MDRQQFAHEEKRVARFQSAAVISAGQGIFQVAVPGASSGWSEVGQGVDTDLQPGQRALMLSASEHDNALIIAGDSWITG
jgi:hypothetical protein